QRRSLHTLEFDQLIERPIGSRRHAMARLGPQPGQILKALAVAGSRRGEGPTKLIAVERQGTIQVLDDDAYASTEHGARGRGRRPGQRNGLKHLDEVTVGISNQ